MNPVVILIGFVGLVLLIAGFRGKQDDWIAAATGKPYGSSTLT